MVWPILLLIIMFAYFDLSLLRKQSAVLFQEIFRLPSWIWIIYGILLALLYNHTRDEADIFAVILFFLLPVYLIKRHQFNKNFAIQQPEPSDVQLASDTFELIIYWFLAVIGTVLVMKIVQPSASDKSELGDMVLLALLSSVIMLFLIYRLVRRYPYLQLKEVLGLQMKSQSWVKLILLPVIAGTAFAFIGTKVILGRSHQPVTPLNEAIDATSSSNVILAFLGVAVFIAPILEEFIFRGYFFYIINKFKGSIFAVCFITAAFGFLHMDQYWGDWLAIGMVTLLGFILTSLRAWTGSSIPGIVMHYVYNAGMTILLVVMLVVSNPSYFEYQSQYNQLSAGKKEELLLKNIKQSPDYIEAYNDLAWLYAEEGEKLEEALKLIDHALDSDPERAAFLDTKAEILYKSGRIAEAVDIEQALVDRYSSDPDFKEHLQEFRRDLSPK